MKKNNSPLTWYITGMLVLCFGLGGLEYIFKTGTFYNILQKGFTAFPVIIALVVQKRTMDEQKIRLSLKVWKNWKMWLFSAFVPAILVVLGVTLYFTIFKEEYGQVFQIGKLFGSEYSIIITNPVFFSLVCVVISVAFIPLQLLELGEEVGWRGYVLWHQVEKHGVKKAVLINSLQWGLVHMPLIYFGFNYSNENPGAPWSNMAIMMLLCIVLGILMSYVTLKTENCMYAAIIHGVFNIIAEIPVFCSVSLKSGLLGPNPTGVLSMVFFIILAIVLYFRLDKAR